MAAHFVYIVRCCDDSLYTGITTDIARRVEEHNTSPRAARYTRARRPVQLVYAEKAVSLSSALKREATIKQLSRKGKLLLVHNQACTNDCNALQSPHMAKRTYVDIRQKKSRSHKTKKRLAVKATMLAAKKAKKRR